MQRLEVRRTGSWGGREFESLTTRLIAHSFSPFFSDVPFEFVGKVSGASSMAEASNVESSATSARHSGLLCKLVKISDDLKCQVKTNDERNNVTQGEYWGVKREIEEG